MRVKWHFFQDKKSNLKRNLKTILYATVSVLCMCSAWWFSKPLRDKMAIDRQNKTDVYTIVQITHRHTGRDSDVYVITNMYQGWHWEKRNGAVEIHQDDKRSIVSNCRVVYSLYGDISVSACGMYTNYPNRVNK
jgi:hypothetical protein